jgi:hypothetical protein
MCDMRTHTEPDYSADGSSQVATRCCNRVVQMVSEGGRLYILQHACCLADLDRDIVMERMHFYSDRTVEELYSLFQLGISCLPIVFVRYDVKKQIQWHRVVGLEGGDLSTKAIHRRRSEPFGHTKALEPSASIGRMRLCSRRCIIAACGFQWEVYRAVPMSPFVCFTRTFLLKRKSLPNPGVSEEFWKLARSVSANFRRLHFCSLVRTGSENVVMLT